MLRLDRWLVTLGVGSRSEMQKLIRKGGVKVNGQPVTDPGRQVDENSAQLTVQGTPVDGRLTRPLYHAVTFCRRLLGTPFPETFLRSIRPFRGSFVPRNLMLLFVPLSMEPEISGEETRCSSFARFCLYVRSHFLRMPLRLLIPHLWTKYWQRKKERKEKLLLNEE